MSFGLQILNATGDVQIDADFRNHRIEASGSVVTGTPPFWPDARLAKVTLPSPIAMSRSPLVWGRTGLGQVPCGLVGMEINASSELTGFWLATRKSNAGVGGDFPGATVEWRVTSVADGASGASYGLQVFDASGAVAFDSGHAYLDISHVSSPVWVIESIGTFLVIAPDNLITHASLSSPWYCLSACAYARTVSPSGDDTMWECAMAQQISLTQSRLMVLDYAYLGGDTLLAFIGGAPQQRQLVMAA